MSFNGSGTFQINTAGQPVVSGTVISSTAFNALTADLATGLSTCITKDGQTTVTANLPMAGYKFTGLGAGSAATDSANLSQVQSTVVKLLGSVSGADTITAVGSPVVTAYAAGQMFYFVAAGANTTTVTLNIDGLGAKAVTRDGATALAAGDIQSGEVCVVVYDGTRFQLINAANSFGNTTINGTLTVTGNTNLQANVSITSALNVGGVATITGTVGIGNSTGLSGKLGVSGNLSLSGAGTGARYMAMLDESASYAGSLILQAGGGSAGFGGGIAMYGHSHATYPGATWIGYSTGSSTGILFGSGGNGVGSINMTLDASGRLIVGGSSAVVGFPVEVVSNSSGQSISLRGRSSDASAALTFNANAAATEYARISSDNTSVLAFGTGSSGTERARITSGGDFLVGKTAASIGNVGFEAKSSGFIASVMTASTNAADTLNVYSTGASAYRFYVQLDGKVNATNTTIAAISDQRLKENIRDLDVGLNEIISLKPRKFDWKEGKGANTKDARGFIAQEFEQVFPDMIDTWKDPAPEGEEPYKSVRADLIPVLVKAIQELKAELDATKAKVAALESK